MTTINQQMSNIVETAIASGEFRTLVQAVQAAGLVETLKGQGPFTVFAPTDEAFRSLPTGTLEGLLKDLPRLKSILTYHVVNRRIMSSEMHELASGGRTPNITTLQGSAVTLKTQGMVQKSIYVDGAKLIRPDIETTNGVIQVIDKVLMPR